MAFVFLASTFCGRKGGSSAAEIEKSQYVCTINKAGNWHFNR